MKRIVEQHALKTSVTLLSLLHLLNLKERSLTMSVVHTVLCVGYSGAKGRENVFWLLHSNEVAERCGGNSIVK